MREPSRSLVTSCSSLAACSVVPQNDRGALQRRFLRARRAHCPLGGTLRHSSNVRGSTESGQVSLRCPARRVEVGLRDILRWEARDDPEMVVGWGALSFPHCATLMRRGGWGEVTGSYIEGFGTQYPLYPSPCARDGYELCRTSRVTPTKWGIH